MCYVTRGMGDVLCARLSMSLGMIGGAEEVSFWVMIDVG